MHFVFANGHYSAGILVLRLGLAVVFWVHGTMKAQFRKMQPNEQLTASALRNLRLLSYAEPLGAATIAVGFLTQITALCFVIVMILAIRLKRNQKMPFMARGSAGGWEFELVLLLMALAVVLLGPGRISIDHHLFGI